MLNIFVDLIPQVNRNFLTHLCRNFRVIAFQGFISEMQKLGVQHLPLKALEELVPPVNLQIPEDEVTWELYRYWQYVDARLSGLLPEGSDPLLRREDFSSTFEIARGIAYRTSAFRKLAARVKIDLLVVNSDWIHGKRCLVVEAKRLGIPTLNIEHAFYGWLPEPEAYRFRPPLRFLSDYVNLDNELDKEIVEKYYKAAGYERKITFLANGTPTDADYDIICTSTSETLDLSSFERDRFTITLVGMWIPMFRVSAAFQAQIEVAETYKAILASLAAFSEEERPQVVVKLHPKSSLTNSFADEKRFLQWLSDELGVRIALITTQHLPEILARSDLAVFPGFTSAVWDAFMASVPGIVYLPPSYLAHTFYKEKLNNSNLLCRSRCLRYVFSPHEFIDTVRFYMDSDNHTQCRRAMEQIRAQKGIDHCSVDEKSERICNWIKQMFSEERDLNATSLRVAPLVPELTAHRDGNRKSLSDLIAYVERMIVKGDFHEAERICSLAVKWFENNTRAWLLRARVLQLMNQPLEALSAIEHSIELDETPEALIELTHICRVLGLNEQAHEVITYLEQRFPGWSRYV